jgi:hypothetical protein
VSDDPTRTSDQPPDQTEADERFAARLAEDLGRILGTGILIDELDLGAAVDGPTRIRVLCLFDGGAEALEAEGETRLEAYNRLVGAAAEMRLAIGTRRMIAPT